jgi:tRNA-modifying protein YgfZ
MLDFETTYEAIRSGVVGRVLPADVVSVTGPDAKSYLQGQVTQDLEALGVGEGVETLLLSPQGKLELAARVFAGGPEELFVEVEAGYGQTALERLARFKLRVKATLELLGWSLVELRGPLAEAAAAGQVGKDGTFVLAYRFGPFVGVDLLGPDAALPDGVEVGDDAAFEVARIEAGVPRMGSELTEKTIPQEAGIVERTVSFTKGCYTGQELVARIDSRGNRVPVRLCGVVLEAGSPAPSPGDLLLNSDREVGTLTSVGYSPQLGRQVALAYLKREVDPPAELEVMLAGGRRRADALPLPLDVGA